MKFLSVCFDGFILKLRRRQTSFINTISGLKRVIFFHWLFPQFRDLMCKKNVCEFAQSAETFVCEFPPILTHSIEIGWMDCIVLFWEVCWDLNSGIEYPGHQSYANIRICGPRIYFSRQSHCVTKGARPRPPCWSGRSYGHHRPWTDNPSAPVAPQSKCCIVMISQQRGKKNGAKTEMRKKAKAIIVDFLSNWKMMNILGKTSPFFSPKYPKFFSIEFFSDVCSSTANKNGTAEIPNDDFICALFIFRNYEVMLRLFTAD